MAKGETLDPARTRSRLLDTATDVFYAHGTSVGVDLIAARAGVGKPTLYRHFGDKDGLLEAVLRRRSDRVIAWLRAAADERDEPRERLLAVFDALQRWHRETTFRGCAIVNAATQAPGDGPARDVAGLHLGRYRELLSELAAACGVPDPEATGRQLLILVEGATTVAAVGGDGDAAADARALARALVGA